jgi:type IV pilus assembly PilX-like protein
MVMKKMQNCPNDEQGFVLIAALLVMLVLTLIGIAANKNTSTELGIAGNDRTHKESFYEADGGTELASEVLEQNVACLQFEDDAGDGRVLLGGTADYNIFVDNDSLGFWRNFSPAGTPSDTSYDFYYPENEGGSWEPHTNFTVAGNTKLTTGSAIQMAAGYEGRGKGIGVGGAIIVYDITAQHLGKNNSESVIYIQYRHTIGQEGDCMDDT